MGCSAPAPLVGLCPVNEFPVVFFFKALCIWGVGIHGHGFACGFESGLGPFAHVATTTVGADISIIFGVGLKAGQMIVRS